MSNKNIIAEYTGFQQATSFYAHHGEGNIFELTYLADGLVGEAGEFVDAKKKMERIIGFLDPKAYSESMQKGSTPRESMLKELGDVFWYLNMICVNVYGITIHELMVHNTYKLYMRHCHGMHPNIKAEWPFSDANWSLASCHARWGGDDVR